MKRIVELCGWISNYDVSLSSDSQSAMQWVIRERSLPTRAKHIDCEVLIVRSLEREKIIEVE